MKYCGMNILQYIDYLMEEFQMSEADAELEASCAFGLMENNEEEY